MVVALMSLLLLTALGIALVLTTSTESMISANFNNGQEALYAAEAGIERSMQDVLTVADWNTIISGATTSAFVDGAAGGERRLPGGGTIDLSQAMNMANCNKVDPCSAADMNQLTAERRWGTNNPRWQLYAYAPLNDLLPTSTINSNFYVVVFVADDASEVDGDPSKDTNGVLAMRAEAFGPGNSHKVIEVTLARTDATELERGYIGQRGQDEQNRRARKAAVQTPGKALSMSEFSIASGGRIVQ